MSWEGYNFEDAIIVSERLVKKDTFTSIHIDEFTAEVRETRLGKEEFTNDIPNVSERSLRNLDEHGVVREGTKVYPGDILVGKVVPKSKTELTPEEKNKLAGQIQALMQKGDFLNDEFLEEVRSLLR